MNKEQKATLHNMYNATMKLNQNGNFENYMSWLERQLYNRVKSSPENLQIIELNRRREKIKKKKRTVITIAEIEINFNQIGQICGPLSGLEKQEMIEYYTGKIHGNILLSESIFTTREDQPDIQYLFDLGVQALSTGMKLKKEQSNQPELYTFTNETL